MGLCGKFFTVLLLPPYTYVVLSLGLGSQPCRAFTCWVKIFLPEIRAFKAPLPPLQGGLWAPRCRP